MLTAYQLLGPLAQNQYVQTVLQNEYAQALVILAVFLVGAAVFHFVLQGLLGKITKRTETDVDDRIFGILAAPVFVTILLFGGYFATLALSVFSGYEAYIEGGFFVVMTLIAAFVGSRIVGLVVGGMIAAHVGVSKAPNLLLKLLNIVVFIVALLAILNHFHVDVTAAVAALGLGGIAIGLALQGTLTNFFSGLHIVTDRPVNVGDYIEVKAEGIEGYVEDIGWRSTRIRTLPNNVAVVPNSKLAESVIVNNTLESKEMGFVVKCGVGYGSDLKKVEDVTLEVARNVQNSVTGAVKGFEPLVRFNNFGDSNVEFSVILRVDEFASKYLVTHEFIKALKERYDREGIEISWPVRKIFYGDGQKPGAQ